MAVTLFVEFCLEVALLRLGAPNVSTIDGSEMIRFNVLDIRFMFPYLMALSIIYIFFRANI